MKLKSMFLGAAAAVAFVPAASAYEGLYGAIGAGLSYNNPDLDVEGSAPPFAFDSELDYENGIGVYTAIGYAYSNGIRGELEFAYRQNDVRHLPGDGLGFAGLPTQLTGDAKAFTGFANILYDLTREGFVQPYVGVGAGIIHLSAEYSGTNPTAPNGPFSLAVDDSQRRFGVQGIAGLAFPLADNLSLDLSYRYVYGIGRFGLDATVNGAATEINQTYRNHSLFAGLRWNFGAPAAAPAAVQYKDCWDGSSVPVSSECPPQISEGQDASLEPVNFVVYFDYDKANLTPEAANLVREASARALANDIDTVVVEGHTDTVGGSAYNQALSQRRANVVRDALIANGVAADRIRTEAFGKARPAKPTPDGVREPLNRRTEVTISFE